MTWSLGSPTRIVGLSCWKIEMLSSSVDGVTLSAEDMQMTPKLELVVRAGSVSTTSTSPYCSERGIRVVRIPGPSSQAVAELTIGLILALSGASARPMP